MSIQFKRKTTATGAPAGGSLLAGELALNTFDQKIYTSSDGIDIIEMGSAGGNGTVTSVNSILPDGAGNILINTDNIAEGSTNFYFTSARFDTSFATKTTSNLAEGTNLYYTEARGIATFNTVFGSKTTDDLTEGSTNLYFTDARADARIQAAIVDTTASTTTLYSSAKVESLLLSGVSYKGHWDPTTNASGTIQLRDGSGNNGDYYIADTDGTADFSTAQDGSRNVSFKVGDYVLYSVDNGQWEKSLNSTPVDSVNGNVGAVVLNTDDINEGVTNLYYTDARVDTYVNTLGFATIDDASVVNNKTWSSQKISGLISDAEEVDDNATTASTTKVWSINKINQNYMPIDVDFGTYI